MKSNDRIIIFLILMILSFELIQFIRTYGTQDSISQFGLLFGTINITIIIYVSHKVGYKQSIILLKKFAVLSSIILFILLVTKIYGLATSTLVISDVLGKRIMLTAKGIKETISNSVIIPLVIFMGLYRNEVYNKKERIDKLIVLIGLLSVLLQLVIAFHRGLLITVVLVFLFYLYNKSNLKGKRKILKKVIQISFVLIFGYIIASVLFPKYGYNPMERIEETFYFMIDVKNPSWDKGRSFSRMVALSAWRKSVWLGYGYDTLFNHGLPLKVATAHNYIVTSLFHRGIIGTLLYLLLILVFIKKIFNLWVSLNRGKNDIYIKKILIITILLWFIPFWTQEIIFERYSTSIQYFYLGIILIFERYNYINIKTSGNNDK